MTNQARKSRLCLNLSAENRALLAQLSLPAYKLLLLVAGELESNPRHKEVFLHSKQAAKGSGSVEPLSKSTFYDAIHVLLNVGVLAKGEYPGFYTVKEGLFSHAKAGGAK